MSKSRLDLRLSLIVALAALFAVAPARESHAQLAVGATAPNFNLIDTQGTPQSLVAYADQVRVLFFVGWN